MVLIYLFINLLYKGGFIIRITLKQCFIAKIPMVLIILTSKLLWNHIHYDFGCSISTWILVLLSSCKIEAHQLVTKDLIKYLINSIIFI